MINGWLIRKPRCWPRVYHHTWHDWGVRRCDIPCRCSPHPLFTVDTFHFDRNNFRQVVMPNIRDRLRHCPLQTGQSRRVQKEDVWMRLIWIICQVHTFRHRFKWTTGESSWMKWDELWGSSVSMTRAQRGHDLLCKHCRIDNVRRQSKWPLHRSNITVFPGWLALGARHS